MAGPRGYTQGAPGSSGRLREQGENMGNSFNCGFHEKEVRQGKQV